MNLGKTILELRKKKNVTQEDLAAELGVTAAAVSKWENGYTLPDVLMLCALADYFQVSTDALLGRTPKPLCAAVATSISTELAQQIAELVKQYGFHVKHIIYGSYEEALRTVNANSAFTHLFVSYDDAQRQYDSDDTKARIVCSNADTVEHILHGFEVYLKNMPHFDALELKNNT